MKSVFLFLCALALSPIAQASFSVRDDASLGAEENSRLLQRKSGKKYKKSKKSGKSGKIAKKKGSKSSPTAAPVEAPIEETKTIIDYFLENAEKLGDKTFMTQPLDSESIKTFSYKEVLESAKKVAGYIESLGFEPKSHIAICSMSCAYFVIVDLAIWIAGHVSVPILPTATAETTRYMLEHSESKMIFIGKLDEEHWEAQKAGVITDMQAFSSPMSPKDTLGAKAWEDVIETSPPINTPVTRIRDEMATIIYTSGSTGKPKGVMISFKAMTDATKGFVKHFDITSKDRYLSYLPVAHGMERLIGMCIPLLTGMQVWYTQALDTLATDINRCEPTLFLSIPHLWEKFQAEVLAEMPELLENPPSDSITKKLILKMLGLSKVRIAGSGSAPIPADLLSWYRSLGLELIEGYGMTETFNYSHMGTPGQIRPGYVGNTYDDVTCRIADDGEILVKTPGAMMGYFKDPELTAQVVTDDGYILTGDKGFLDEKQRLKITGRIKELSNVWEVPDWNVEL